MRRDRDRQLRSAFLVAAIAAGVLFVLPAAVHAQTVNLGLTPQVGGALGLGTADIRVIAARIIRNFFGLLGIVAVVIILYGGFLWMTSAGEEETINKAKRVIVNGVIGLAIILSAVAITQFILNRLVEATGTQVGGGPGGGGAGVVPRSGALGQGIVESHYPERGETGVARNTRIVITFKQPMDLASVIAGFDPNDPASSTKHDLDDKTIRIYRAADGVGGAFKSTDVQVYYTPDLRTFVFHVPLLGSPTVDVPYIVSLVGGDAGLRTIDATGKSVPAFDGSFADGYAWDFATGTFIDTTPPVVESVIPVRNSKNPRNTLIEVTMSEAIDPTSAVGHLPGFGNETVVAAAPVAGSFSVGNRYRTLTFVSDDLCGTNSCGGAVYCLPPDSAIAVRLRAASLGPNPPEADPTKVPADGVTDMTGNSLDGDGDGVAEGPGDAPKDDYAWSFATDGTIDLVPPAIQATSPAKDAARVMPEKPVTADFTKVMSLGSFTPEAVGFSALPTPPEPTCYSLSGEHVDATGVAVTSTAPVGSRMILSHCLLYPDTNYIPQVSSKVTDIRQNCYLPGANTLLTSCSPAAMAAGGYSFCCNGQPCKKACTIAGATATCTP